MFTKLNEEVDSLEKRLARKNRINPQNISITSKMYLYIYMILQIREETRDPGDSKSSRAV
jgi:hypothetical protein